MAAVAGITRAGELGRQVDVHRAGDAPGDVLAARVAGAERPAHVEDDRRRSRLRARRRSSAAEISGVTVSSARRRPGAVAAEQVAHVGEPGRGHAAGGDRRAVAAGAVDDGGA